MVERGICRPDKPKVSKPIFQRNLTMITSMTKLIAAVAMSAGLLTTNTVFAKGGPGKGAGSGSNHVQSQKMTSSFNAFKLNTNNNLNNRSTSLSGISKKPIT